MMMRKWILCLLGLVFTGWSGYAQINIFARQLEIAAGSPEDVTVINGNASETWHCDREGRVLSYSNGDYHVDYFWENGDNEVRAEARTTTGGLMWTNYVYIEENSPEVLYYTCGFNSVSFHFRKDNTLSSMIWNMNHWITHTDYVYRNEKDRAPVQLKDNFGRLNNRENLKADEYGNVIEYIISNPADDSSFHIYRTITYYPE